MSNPISDDDGERIRAAIFAGRKIEAIKLYRECTGLGLKEAKDFVELLESELRRTALEKFTAGPAAQGCTIVVFALGFVLFGAMWVPFAIQEGWPHWSRMLGSQRTEGVISKMVREVGDEPEHLIVEYQVGGQTFRIRHNVVLSPGPYAAGQAVGVRYQPNNPRDGVVDTFRESWLIPAAIGSVGLFFAVIGIGMLRFRARITKALRVDPRPLPAEPE